MAISTGAYYGNSEREMYEREMFYRRQEEEYRKLRQSSLYNAGQQQAMLGQAFVNTAPKPDPKDPLSFLSKADNKLLLTGAST
jgi:hypothetical protein